MHAAVGFSRLDDASSAVEEAVSAVARRLQGRPDLVLLFATSDYAEEIQLVRDRVLQRLAPAAMLGGSTTGVISPEGEHEDQRGLGILALSGVRATTHLLSSAEELAALDTTTAALTLALPDPMSLDHDLLAALAAIPLLAGGAISGNRGAMFALSHDQSGEGLTGVAVLHGISARVGVTQGASPAGPFRRVTRARRNVVLELSGHPAGEALRAHVHAAGAQAEDQLPALLYAALRHPGETGHVIRPIVGVDPQAGGFLLPDELEEGMELAFAFRETLAAMRDREAMLKQVSLGAAAPVAALYFNCAGRGARLHLEADADLRAIARALPGVPLLGMTSSFELAGPRLLMYSGVLVVVAEG
jgi:small ligand-binding sensory domain FIST